MCYRPFRASFVTESVVVYVFASWQAREYEKARLLTHMLRELRKSQNKSQREAKKAAKGEKAENGDKAGAEAASAGGKPGGEKDKRPVATLTPAIRESAFPNLTWDAILGIFKANDIVPDPQNSRAVRRALYTMHSCRVSVCARYALYGCVGSTRLVCLP